jgi:hypothetical protein
MKECFVIMPIGAGDAYQIYRNRYDLIIEPAISGYSPNGARAFRCTRADLVTTTGSITRDMLGRLITADVVLADLTDLNPNVFASGHPSRSARSGLLLVRNEILVL